jgi:hypothetical protein
MAEYAGLIPLQPVDWGKVAQDAAKPITDVIQDRDQQRKDLEKINSESLSAIQKYEQNKAPNGAQFIMNASQEGRSYIMAQYELLTSGQITPEEYKRNTQNTRESFGMLNTYMKTYEQDIQKAQERIDTGEAGSMERYLTDYRSKVMDLAGKRSNFGNNGSMYITDEAGQVFDLQSLNMGINKQPARVDLVDEVDRSLKGLGIGAKSVDGVYTISNKLVGDWEKTKKGLKDAILNNPNKISSVLADNVGPGVYSFTTNPSEAGGNVILIEADQNGVMISKPTSEQRKVAEEAVDNFIESRIKIEEKEVDKTKSWALSIEDRKVKLAERKQAFDEKQAAIPLQRRVNTISEILETGNPGELVGASIQGADERGVVDASGEVTKRYAGYQFAGIRPAKDGYTVSLTIREKDKKGNENTKTEEVFYTKKSLVSALNNALSARSTSDEYKNINAEEVTPYLDLMGGSAPAKKTTGNKKPTQAP